MHPFVQPATTPFEADLALGPLQLEGGAQLAQLRMRVWMLGRQVDHDALAAGKLLPDFPTVVVVHPLSSTPVVAGPSGFWDELVGKGRALRPWKQRILSFN
jgi:homoserine acetyltransferase